MLDDQVLMHLVLFSISNPTDSQTWGAMAAIKSSILRRMDKEPSGVKVCCVKFIQRVVQVQTPGQIADPRVRDTKNTFRIFVRC